MATLAAGVDLRIVQEMLGHSSIVLTADTYTSVLPHVAHAAAEKVAALIVRASCLVPAPGGDGIDRPLGPTPRGLPILARASRGRRAGRGRTSPSDRPSPVPHRKRVR